MTRTKKTGFTGFETANFAWQGAMLALEAQQVMALRLAKFAQGSPAALREANIAVTEKILALAEAGEIARKAAASGTRDMGAAAIVQHYRKKVRANRRRLAT